MFSKNKIINIRKIKEITKAYKYMYNEFILFNKTNRIVKFNAKHFTKWPHILYIMYNI